MTKIYEVKTLDEAIALAVKDFGLPEEELKIEITKEIKGFLGIGARLEVVVSLALDGVDIGHNYLKKLLINAGFNGFVEKKIRGKNVHYNVDAGKDNGTLIGKNAKILQSIQLLVSNVVNKHYSEEEGKIVLVDVGGYRKKREKHLEFMAINWAKEVTKTKSKTVIKDLNAYERKIVHDKLTSWREVVTYSEGEGQDRVLIIEYKKGNAKH